jgi:hypothetical protein
MFRLVEVGLGYVVATVLTGNFVIAALIGVVLFVAWEVHDYGFMGRKKDVWDHYGGAYDDDEERENDMEREDTDA